MFSVGVRGCTAGGGEQCVVGRGVLIEACVGAEVEAEAGPDAAGPPLPLLQVGLGGPDRGVVGHVVVGREQLHLLPAHTHTHTHTHREYTW